MALVHFSRKYLVRLKTRTKAYGSSLLFLLVFYAVTTNGSLSSVGSFFKNIGTTLLIIVGVFILLLPTLFVQIFNVKGKNPRAYYVEPTPLEIGILTIGLGYVAAFIIGAILAETGTLTGAEVVALAVLGFFCTYKSLYGQRLRPL